MEQNKPKMLKVARLYFQNTGEGMTRIPKSIWGNAGVERIRNVDADLQKPKSCNAAFGAVTDKKIVPDDVYVDEATPYDYVENKFFNGKPMGAFTIREYKHRIGHDGYGGNNRIGQAIKAAKKMGEPLGVDIFDIPESSVLGGDDDQVIFDNNEVGGKPKLYKGDKNGK